MKDADGDLIVKLVNVTGEAVPVDMKLTGLAAGYGATAQRITLRGDSAAAANSFTNPQSVYPAEDTVTVSDEFTLEVPAYSLTVLRIPKK